LPAPDIASFSRLTNPCHNKCESAGSEFQIAGVLIRTAPEEEAHHAAAVSLYVARYDLCRVHEALRTTAGVASGRLGILIDAVLPLKPNRPVRIIRSFRIIDGGKN
jgi:hypothetical protein